ncbi:hypothetical protein NL676_024190 [Syzygium grande]|nr:hypothetical protein NL676_024190 [Syzygium grande]
MAANLEMDWQCVPPDLEMEFMAVELRIDGVKSGTSPDPRDLGIISTTQETRVKMKGRKDKGAVAFQSMERGEAMDDVLPESTRSRPVEKSRNPPISTENHRPQIRELRPTF